LLKSITVIFTNTRRIAVWVLSQGSTTSSQKTIETPRC